MADTMHTLNSMLIRVAAEAGDKEGLVFLDKKFTFKEILENSLRYAAFFMENGVKRGDHIAIVLDNSHQFIFSFFGILFAGGIVIPIGPKSKANRIKRIIEDSHITLVIFDTFNYNTCKTNLINEIPLISEFICFPEDIESSPQFLLTDFDMKKFFMPDVNDIAFFQYTSGTTGFSKGVMISHRAVLANIIGICKRLDLRMDDVYSSLMPLYHDMGLIGFCLVPIYSALKLILFPQTVMVLYSWLKAFAQHKVTISGASNTLLNLTHKVVENPKDYDCSSLRYMICGSEPLYPQVLKKFEMNYDAAGKVLSAYGMAELSLCVTMQSPGTQFQVDKRNIVSCGRPLENIEIKIDSPASSIPGEILIKSPARMDGYYQKEEETRTVMEGEFLRTGDLGYLNENSELFVIGRIKNIIIRDGENLSPGDLEEVAIKYPQVRNAAVVVVEDQKREQKDSICLVIETNKAMLEKEDEANELKSRLIKDIRKNGTYLFDKLYIVRQGTIPFSTNGKMQHQALREMIRNNNIGSKYLVL